jgi:hypothetical protein
LRPQVVRLARAGWSRRAIMAELGVSRGFVDHWAGDTPGPLEADQRGWPTGTARRYPPAVLRRVQALHQQLVKDPTAFFTGATALQQAYARRYPRSALPSLRTLGRMLRALGCSTPRQRGRQRGAAAYLGYPTQTLATLAPRVLELDFIGPRYLAGSAAPLHFVGVSCQRAPRLRYFYRVESVTTAALLTVCADLLQRHEHPLVLKVDNAPVTIGSGSAPRTVSRFVQWLWARGITPVFAVPRQPFSQASIEGNNSVFARKFWRARTFTSVADVDRQLTWFNRASLAYTGYAPPPPRPHPPRGLRPASTSCARCRSGRGPPALMCCTRGCRWRRAMRPCLCWPPGTCPPPGSRCGSSARVPVASSHGSPFTSTMHPSGRLAYFHLTNNR